jgi:hypothetical protein
MYPFVVFVRPGLVAACHLQAQVRLQNSRRRPGRFSPWYISPQWRHGPINVRGDGIGQIYVTVGTMCYRRRGDQPAEPAHQGEGLDRGVDVAGERRALLAYAVPVLRIEYLGAATPLRHPLQPGLPLPAGRLRRVEKSAWSAAGRFNVRHAASVGAAIGEHRSAPAIRVVGAPPALAFPALGVEQRGGTVGGALPLRDFLVAVRVRVAHRFARRIGETLAAAVNLGGGPAHAVRPLHLSGAHLSALRGVREHHVGGPAASGMIGKGDVRVVRGL